MASLSADALSELQQILTSYEKTTQSLSDRLDFSENNTQALSISIGSMNNSLNSLQANSKLQKDLLAKQSLSIQEMQEISKSSARQIKSLETGYASMEKRLGIYKTVTTVTIITVVVLVLKDVAIALWT